MTKRGGVRSGDTIEVPGVGTFRVSTYTSATVINTALRKAEEEAVLLEPAKGGEAVPVNLRLVLSAILQLEGLRRP